MDRLLSIRGLSVTFATKHGPVRAVRGVDLDLRPHEVLGVVGESGSGKTVMVKAVMGVIRPRRDVEISGSVVLRGLELICLSDSQLRQVQGRQIALIFQDPMSALDPLMRVGSQVIETLQAHTDLSRREALARAARLLQEVEIPRARDRLLSYPHQLSGGMRQRVMIAMALACDPLVLIADEPTTALDVTTQASVLALLNRLRRERGSSIIFVTHDLAVLAQLADRVMVMYAGRCVEQGPIDKIYRKPRHPYTIALLASSPSLISPGARLRAIDGSPPAPEQVAPGCAFAPRCPFAFAKCNTEEPSLDFEANDLEHAVRCWLSAEERDAAHARLLAAVDSGRPAAELGR